MGIVCGQKAGTTIAVQGNENRRLLTQPTWPCR